MLSFELMCVHGFKSNFFVARWLEIFYVLTEQVKKIL